MNVGVIGTGYVGLITAVCFARKGNSVTGFDTDTRKIEGLNAKPRITPIYEAGLEDALNETLGKTLALSTRLEDAVRGKDVIFIAVPTPPKLDGSADLSYVENSVQSVVKHLSGYATLVLRSTAPAGTADAMKLMAEKYHNGHDFDFAGNPEFLRQGTAIEDFEHPDRIVIGTESERAESLLRKLYEPFDRPIYKAGLRSAEAVKVISNTLLAQRVADANFVARYSDAIGADQHEILHLVGQDKRIGSHFLEPGPGFGGSCFPKDVAALVAECRKLGVKHSLIETILKDNHDHMLYVAEQTERLCGELRGKTVGVLGLAFKAGTDDMREAVSIPIIRHLQGRGARIQAYDPQSMEKAKPHLPDITYCDKSIDAVRDAHIALLLTNWPEFKLLSPQAMRKEMESPVVYDTRNALNGALFKKAGLIYRGMGRR